MVLDIIIFILLLVATGNWLISLVVTILFSFFNTRG